MKKQKRIREKTAKTLAAVSAHKAVGSSSIEIESLESRILLSSVFILGANKSVSYHDADGDHVTVSTGNTAAAIYYDDLGGGRADVSQILVGSNNGSVGVFVKAELITPANNVSAAEYSNGFTTIGAITAAVAGNNITVDAALGETITGAGGANYGTSMAITSTVSAFNRVVLDAAVIDHVDLHGVNLNSITLGVGQTQAWDNYYANNSQIAVPATSSLANVVLNDVTANSVGLIKINGATSALTAPLFGVLNGPVNNFNGVYDIDSGLTTFEGLKSSFNGVFDGANVAFKLNAMGIAPNFGLIGGGAIVQPPSVYATGDVHLDIGVGGVAGGTFIAGDDLFIRSTGGITGGQFNAGDDITGLDGGRILIGNNNNLGPINADPVFAGAFLAGGDIADIFAPTAVLGGSFTSLNGNIGAITAQSFGGVAITAPNGDIGALTQLDSSVAFNANVTTSGDLHAIVAPGGIAGSYTVGGNILTDSHGRSIVAGGEVSAVFQVVGSIGEVEIIINNPATVQNGGAFTGVINAGTVGDIDIDVNIATDSNSNTVHGLTGFVGTNDAGIGDIDITMGALAIGNGLTGAVFSNTDMGTVSVHVLGQAGGSGITGALTANGDIGAIHVDSVSKLNAAINGAGITADADGDFAGGIASVTVESAQAGISNAAFAGASIGAVKVTNTGLGTGIYESSFLATKGAITSVEVVSKGNAIDGFFGSNFTGESIGNVSATSAEGTAAQYAAFTATEGSIGNISLIATKGQAAFSLGFTAKGDVGTFEAKANFDGHAVNFLNITADSDGDKTGNAGAITVENLATEGFNVGAIDSSNFNGWEIGNIEATSNSLESQVSTVNNTTIGTLNASKIGAITVENKSTDAGSVAAINALTIGNFTETVQIGAITTKSSGATALQAGSANLTVSSKLNGELGNVTVSGNLSLGAGWQDNLAKVGNVTVGGTLASTWTLGANATDPSSVGLITVGAAAGNAAAFDFDTYNGAPNDATVGGVPLNAPGALGGITLL